MDKSIRAKELWDEISSRRTELGKAYEKEGSTPLILALSQELDKLLNQFDELMRSEE